MELKTFTEKMLSAFSVDDIQGLSDLLLDAAISHKTFVFDEYLKLAPDTRADYLRSVWQFYEADREEKKQDYTPACLGDLLAVLTEQGERTVYDCCAGSGALTIQKWTTNRNLRFMCEELDTRVIPFLLFNLCVRNIGGYVINGNSLTEEQKIVYRLHKGEKYSTVEECAGIAIHADTGISNPPYNIKWQHLQAGRFDARFAESGLPPESNANFAFVLNMLSKINGRMAMILPCGCLSAEPDKDIRMFLTGENLLDSVIMCPDKMFESTSIPVCIVVLDKGKMDRKVTFVDARNSFEVEVREQRGEDYARARVYKKEIKVFTGKIMESILAAIKNRESKVGFCISLETDEISETWMPTRYIQLAKEEVKHRQYEDIVRDINEIVKDKNIFKLTINESLAKQLGIGELAELMQNSNRITDQMNENMKPLGLSFEKESYISLSKSKNEVKFENKNKDSLSSIVMMTLPMYKQHIYYLNEKENKLLAELRDALLPDLVSGKTQLATKNNDS